MIKLTQDSILRFQRSIFLFLDEKNAIKLISDFFQYLIDSEQFNTNGLIITDIKKENQNIFHQIRRNSPTLNRIVTITNDQITTILGQTFDFLILDLRKEFIPNKLCILFDTVKGGGIIFCLGQPLHNWVYSVNKTRFNSNQETLTKDSLKSILLEWFLANFYSNSQCFIDTESISEIVKRYNPMPLNKNLSSKTGNFVVTSDQKKVILALLEEFIAPNNSCSVILANRGRGKSASIGITISQAITSNLGRFVKILISSPYVTNVQTIFKFLIRGLASQSIKYHHKEQEELLWEVNIPKVAKISYVTPRDINRHMKADYYIIDEAAAIPVEILKKTLRKKGGKIFSSTIHGYEGAARGFEYKILKYLEDQKHIIFKKHYLAEPIRYMQGDLIESLLFDTFLLNAELIPQKINYQEICPETMTLTEYSDKEFLFSNKGIFFLRKAFGILIYAHYRNQPNDLLLLADSPKQFLISLSGKDRDNQEYLVAISQLCKEGNMIEREILKVDSGQFLEGNLIPSVAIRHFSKEFSKLNGLRIVRIASHPSLINKGFGRHLIEYQIKNSHSFDWIGVSFGATVKLMKFWKKFGFKALHIRPIKTPETGEWNIILIHPITPPAVAIVEQASSDFLFQFISLLKQSLHSMSPELIVLILKSCVHIVNYKPKITVSGIYRIRKYLEGKLNFLLAVDVIYELAIAYFSSPNEIHLSLAQELLLISRILQGRTWSQTLSQTGLQWKTAHSLLNKAVTKLVHNLEYNSD